ARARPLWPVGRQFHLTTVGKLEISQMDAKPALASAVALDHIAGADRKPAWKTIDRRTHQKTSCATLATVAVMADQRDSSETGRRRADIPVNRCGKRVAKDRVEPQLAPAQSSKPLSRAKSLSDVSGRAPRCWITSAAESAPSRAAGR